MFSNRKIILFIILLVTVSITAYVLLVAIPTKLAERSYEGAKKIGEDIRKAFQFTPQITVNNTVVLQQQTPILEVATLSQKFEHRYLWVNQWMGSTKKIDIRGTFEAKAGFNINKQFTLEISGDDALIVLPEPELLSLTPMHDVTFRDENGIWNWVSAEDRATAMNAFTRDAQRYAQQANFIADAQTSMEKKLKDILKSHGKTLRIEYQKHESLNPM
jgi:hypothetical protein